RLEGEGLDPAGLDPKSARLAQRVGKRQPENAISAVGGGVEIQLRGGLGELQSRAAGGDAVPCNRVGRDEWDRIPRRDGRPQERMPCRRGMRRRRRQQYRGGETAAISPRYPHRASPLREILHYGRRERLALEPGTVIAPGEPAFGEPADHPRVDDVLRGLNPG